VAAAKGDLAAVKRLLSVLDANIKDQLGATPLHEAAEVGHAEVVRLLLSKGADVNAKTTTGRLTPLHVAAGKGHREVAETLINSGADVNAKDHSGDTPLHLTVTWGRKEIASLLLSKGADPTILNDSGATPDMRSTVEVDRLEEVEAARDMVVKHGWIRKAGKTIHAAAMKGDSAELARILDRDPSQLNAQHDFFKTPLHCAAAYGKKEAVVLLLKRGADITGAKADGTPLHSAAQEGHVDVAEVLLARGADVNAKTTARGMFSVSNQTPLHLAAEQGHVEMVKFLLRHGADAKAMNSQGRAPAVMVGVGSAGAAEISKRLLQGGRE
jgi:ankyrin repeat protein